MEPRAQPRFSGEKRPPPHEGVALIIVLAFVVLLSGLIIAFFSRAMSERQISNGSAGQTRADLFAQSATATIIADLKQEIAAGSSPSPDPTPGVVVIYRPNAPATEEPAAQGFAPALSPATELETDGLNNLVKVSTYGQGSTNSFYHGPNYVTATYPAPNRAANCLTTTPAVNGRYVSLARWNKPLLMQPKSTTDLTPVAPNGSPSAYPTPSWILVARNGANPGSNNPMSAQAPTVTFGSSGVNDPSPTNANFVEGRYAYTIYNEGGLLDANVAGYPSVATGNAVAGSSPAITDQTMYKAAVCHADLTQLQDFNGNQVFPTPLPGSTPLVDQLVGWRNNATAAPSGSLGSYSFPAANAAVSITNFYEWATNNLGRFMTSGSPALAASPGMSGNSDRLFVSRQQLIAFFTNGIWGGTTPTTAQQTSMNSALACLGTFSRTLNQPSLWPDPARPRVTLKPATSDNENNAVFDPSIPGGNAAYSDPAAVTPTNPSLSDVYNPAFRGVRVATPFVRADGSYAAVGEPLVKKRFALNRVAWITYQGPSATATNQATLVGELVKRGMTQNDAQTLLNEGTAANIRNYFGLSWNPGPGTGGAGGYWLYDHGIKLNDATVIGFLQDPRPGSASTSTPADVLGAGREADFFELLQAAVNVGAIGKAWGGNGTCGYQAVQDSAITPQILAIGANIIDEASVTQYPTIIRYYFSGPNDLRSVFGKTDLPYYNGDTTFAFVVQTPTALYPSNAVPSPTPSPLPATAAPPVAGLYPAAQGTGAVIMAPAVWNPYDVNSPQVAPGLAPAQLRIVLGNPLPSINASGPAWPTTAASYQLTAHWQYSAQAAFFPPNSPWQPPTAGSGYSYAKSTTTVQNGVSTTTQPTITLTPQSENWASEESTALYFNNVDPSNPATRPLYHEPTLLFRATSSASVTPDNFIGLALGPQQYIRSTNAAWGTGNPPAAPPGVPEANSGQSFIGELVGTFPLRFTEPAASPDPHGNYIYTVNQLQLTPPAKTTAPTWRLEYLAPGTSDLPANWIPYQEKMVLGNTGTLGVPFIAQKGTAAAPYLLTPNDANPADPSTSTSMFYGNANPMIGSGGRPGAGNATITEAVFDPRTDRWSAPGGVATPHFLNTDPASITVPPTHLWMETVRPDANIGGSTQCASIPGWTRPAGTPAPGPGPALGYYSQNLSPPPSAAGTYYNRYDADNITRRASGGENLKYPTTVTGATTTLAGLPLATEMNNANGSIATNLTLNTVAATTSSNRPIMLHRPYRSVAELGYVFSDTPWTNLDFGSPESGFNGLLDVFCISEDTRPDALMAGRVDLNTRQPSVLVAMLADAYREVLVPAPTPNTIPVAQNTLSPNATTKSTPSEATTMADLLVKREAGTLSNQGALTNISDLVGRYVAGYQGANQYTNYQPYDGFSEDILSAKPTSSPSDLVQRFREAPIRALVNQGQVGTWNLLIDVIAQTGRYSPNASTLAQFSVEGERRYWVHVAIDRQTGQLIDQQIEKVNE